MTNPDLRQRRGRANVGQNGRPTWSGSVSAISPKPNKTDLFRRYMGGLVQGDGVWVYRMLSGFVHSGPRVLAAMSQRQAVDPEDHSEVLGVTLTASAEQTRVLTQMELTGLDLALRELEQYAGR